MTSRGSARTSTEASLPAWGRLALGASLLAGTLFASEDPFTLLFFGSYAAVGAILIDRRPRNSIGWLIVAIGWGFIGTTSPPSYDLAGLQAGTAALSDFLWAWLASWSGSYTFALFLALTIVFPSGRLPEDRRERRVAISLLAIAGIVLLLTAFAPIVSFNPDGGASGVTFANRFGLLGWLPVWDVLTPDTLIFPVILLLLVGVAGLLARYRRATDVLRLQLRWLVAAVSFVALAVIAGLSALAVFGEGIGGLAWIPAIIAYPTVPLAIAVAVLRYRLYEIDRIISRTIGWSLVSAVLIAAFAGVVLVLQALLSGITQGQTLAVAASTLAAFALFQPVRHRVQAAVDHRFDRARVDAQHVADSFAGRVRDEVDLLTLRLSLIHAADQSVRPGTSGVWLRRAKEPQA